MNQRRTETESTTLLENLRKMVGVYSTTQATRDDVSQAMIRHWCDAMSDHNPAYTDPAFAARSTHAGLVAPPSMLDTWGMVGLASHERAVSEAGEAVGILPVMKRLGAAGFTASK